MAGFLVYLWRNVKQNRLLSPTDRWTEEAAVGLVDRCLRVEGNKQVVISVVVTTPHTPSDISLFELW